MRLLKQGFLSLEKQKPAASRNQASKETVPDSLNRPLKTMTQSHFNFSDAGYIVSFDDSKHPFSSPKQDTQPESYQSSFPTTMIRGCSDLERFQLARQSCDGGELVQLMESRDSN